MARVDFTFGGSFSLFNFNDWLYFLRLLLNHLILDYVIEIFLNHFDLLAYRKFRNFLDRESLSSILRFIIDLIGSVCGLNIICALIIICGFIKSFIFEITSLFAEVAVAEDGNLFEFCGMSEVDLAARTN